MTAEGTEKSQIVSQVLSLIQLRLPDVLERQELSSNLLSKRILSLILEKHLVVFEYFPASLKIREYFKNVSLKNY